jgi:hypothetical protein
MQNKSHKLVKKALTLGIIKKPKYCSNCLQIKKILYGHHCDYEKPLSITWLCGSCHRKWHSLHKRIPSYSHIKKIAGHRNRLIINIVYIGKSI